MYFHFQKKKKKHCKEFSQHLRVLGEFTQTYVCIQILFCSWTTAFPQFIQTALKLNPWQVSYVAGALWQQTEGGVVEVSSSNQKQPTKFHQCESSEGLSWQQPGSNHRFSREKSRWCRERQHMCRPGSTTKKTSRKKLKLILQTLTRTKRKLLCYRNRLRICKNKTNQLKMHVRSKPATKGGGI